MDIVLGVSMTPAIVRMVLVEGENADGVIVDHDVFDISAIEGSATSSAADQVIAAVLGTKESAEAGGHHLKSIGVTWSDHGEASALRDALAARGIDDVMLVSELHAAAALAQAVGRAVGYDTTALFFIDNDTATLSVVQTDDGSVVKVLSRTLHDDDAMAVLTEMAAAVDTQDSPPQGMFVVGSGVDVSSVKAHLSTWSPAGQRAGGTRTRARPRCGAGSANAPALEASTVGLAYSQDPDGTTAGSVYPGLSNAATQLAPVGRAALVVDVELAPRRRTNRRGAQTVPARRQRADLHLRGRGCGTGDFARREHPADGRPATQPGPERDRSQRPGPGAAAGARGAAGPAAPRPRPRPSRRPCRWCSRPRRPRRRRARCTSSSPPPRRRGHPHPHRFPLRRRRFPPHLCRHRRSTSRRGRRWCFRHWSHCSRRSRSGVRQWWLTMRQWSTRHGRGSGIRGPSGHRSKRSPRNRNGSRSRSNRSGRFRRVRGSRWLPGCRRPHRGRYPRFRRNRRHHSGRTPVARADRTPVARAAVTADRRYGRGPMAEVAAVAEATSTRYLPLVCRSVSA